MKPAIQTQFRVINNSELKISQAVKNNLHACTKFRVIDNSELRKTSKEENIKAKSSELLITRNYEKLLKKKISKQRVPSY